MRTTRGQRRVVCAMAKGEYPKARSNVIDSLKAAGLIGIEPAAAGPSPDTSLKLTEQGRKVVARSCRRG